MPENNELDMELDRQAKELEKKRLELVLRQPIRSRLSEWKRKEQLHQKELEQIQSDCKHLAEYGIPPAWGKRDSSLHCPDCDRRVIISAYDGD